jgi:hypothetical protein
VIQRPRPMVFKKVASASTRAGPRSGRSRANDENPTAATDHTLVAGPDKRQLN